MRVVGVCKSVIGICKRIMGMFGRVWEYAREYENRKRIGSKSLIYAVQHKKCMYMPVITEIFP